MNIRKSMILLFALWMSIGMSAQTQQGNNREERRKNASERLAKHMAKELELNDEMTAWFVPLYKEYQDTLRATRMDRFEIQNQEGLSDEQAEKLVEISFAIDEMRIALKRQYHQRFKEKLSAKQLYKIFMERPNIRRQMPQRNRQQGHWHQHGGNGFSGGDF